MFSYLEATNMQHCLVLSHPFGKLEKKTFFFLDFYLDYNKDKEQQLNKDTQNKLIPPLSTSYQQGISLILREPLELECCFLKKKSLYTYLNEEP